MSTDHRPFADRVMGAVSLEAGPSPTRSLLAALRAGSWTDAVASVGTAWHLSTERAWWIAPGTRVRALALVLSVLMALGAGGALAATTAVRLAGGIGSSIGTGSDLEGLFPAHATPTQAPEESEHPADSPREQPRRAEEGSPTPRSSDKERDEEPSDRETPSRSGANETGDDDGGARDDNSSEGSPKEDGGSEPTATEEPNDDGSDGSDDSASDSSPEPSDDGGSDSSGEGSSGD